MITFPTSSPESYTVSRKFLMPAPEIDYQYPNRNIYDPEILVLLKPQSEKSGYMLKLVTLVYTLNFNVFWIYKQKDQQQR